VSKKEEARHTKIQRKTNEEKKKDQTERLTQENQMKSQIVKNQ
jgi:hypothetical protein